MTTKEYLTISGGKTLLSITEVVNLGYPRKAVYKACKSRYKDTFCQRLSDKPTSKMMINYPVFAKLWDSGVLKGA